ncbi:IS630 family transposase [Methylobacterium sp. WL30]|uniref:IS630 family transposase n=1 Tax=unclassified Methylobacterium TaxID=2615210 RepID=UPI0011CBF886|nr:MULTISPECIES: IS630 family transposase [unclassified Methylobacterium]TXN40717.1 IS630 family transposase [Methylobacterium sp. WL93]TXN49079.1 IS630 family transposase [Methylobacterium sp. WL119]TXN62798.1 IS630 family transposase [Methylobacterium sp. WL30]
MASALSVDLRARVLAAVEEGASRRQAAKRFGVSPTSAIRWYESFGQEGRIAPKPMGGDQRSQTIEAQADMIVSIYEAKPEIFLTELQEKLAERGLRVGRSSLSRFFKRHGITRKNTGHATEQDREDVKADREAWFEGQLDLDPDALVFLDETAANTSMVRRYGRAPRSDRCRVGAPFGHWKTTTVTAALRSSGLIATALLDGATNGEGFRAYVVETLSPALRQGDTVILDNLPAHKVKGVREAVEAAGARLLYLPPYSPDLNPIEMAFAKLKAMLRSVAKRTVADLWDAIRNAFAAFKPDECRRYIAAAGYDAYDPT